jgi:hypothetical protein
LHLIQLIPDSMFCLIFELNLNCSFDLLFLFPFFSANCFQACVKSDVCFSPFVF